MLSLFVVLCLLIITGAHANTEKLIFRAEAANRHHSSCQRAIRKWAERDMILTPPHSTLRDAMIPSSASGQKWYVLDQLEPGMSYELRLSYPATSPTDFWLTLHDACDTARLLGLDIGPRETDDNTITHLVLVEGSYAGVSNVAGIEQAAVTFDLVLENLYAGFLFYQVYRIVIAIVFMLALGHFVFLPLIRRFIRESVAPVKQG